MDVVRGNDVLRFGGCSAGLELEYSLALLESPSTIRVVAVEGLSLLILE